MEVPLFLTGKVRTPSLNSCDSSCFLLPEAECSCRDWSETGSGPQCLTMLLLSGQAGDPGQLCLALELGGLVLSHTYRRTWEGRLFLWRVTSPAEESKFNTDPVSELHASATTSGPLSSKSSRPRGLSIQSCTIATIYLFSCISLGGKSISVVQ